MNLLWVYAVSAPYVAEALILVNVTTLLINNTGTNKVYRHEAAGVVALLPHIQCLIHAGTCIQTFDQVRSRCLRQCLAGDFMVPAEVCICFVQMCSSV